MCCSWVHVEDIDVCLLLEMLFVGRRGEPAQ